MSNLQDQILTKIAKQMQQEIDDEFMATLQYKPHIKIHDQSTVDGETWYTVSCSHVASRWMRSQYRELWHEHIQNKWDVIHNTFDVHEKLYTMMALKWSS